MFEDIVKQNITNAILAAFGDTVSLSQGAALLSLDGENLSSIEFLKIVAGGKRPIESCDFVTNDAGDITAVKTVQFINWLHDAKSLARYLQNFYPQDQIPLSRRDAFMLGHPLYRWTCTKGHNYIQSVKNPMCSVCDTEKKKAAKHGQ